MEVIKCFPIFWTIFLVISQVHISKTAFYKMSMEGKYSGKILKVKFQYFQETLSKINCLLKCDMDVACQAVFYGTKNQKCIGYTSSVIKSNRLKDTNQNYTFLTMETDCERLGFVSNKRYKTCYRIFNTKKTFSDARKKCKSFKGKKGDLVVLKPKQKMEAFLEYLKEREFKSSLWIGVTDIKKEGVWKFLDGQTATYWKYMGKLNNHDAGYPGGADCGFWYQADKKVYDNNCKAKIHFVCELKNVALQ